MNGNKSNCNIDVVKRFPDPDPDPCPPTPNSICKIEARMVRIFISLINSIYAEILFTNTSRPLPTIPDPSIKGIEFRLYVLAHLLPTTPFRWPEFQHRSDYPDHPISANQIRWDTIVPACQRWTLPRRLFSIRCRVEEIQWEGDGPIRAGSMFNQLLPDGQSPSPFPSPTMPLFLTSFRFYLQRFAIFHHRHCFLFVKGLRDDFFGSVFEIRFIILEVKHELWQLCGLGWWHRRNDEKNLFSKFVFFNFVKGGLFLLNNAICSFYLLIVTLCDIL